MSEPEIPLAGGKLNQVVRIHNTVRRPVGPSTPTVHALLGHLAERGFTLAPQPLGFDDQGREVLSYIRGETVGDSLPWPDWTWSEDLLAEVGRAARRYHHAVEDFRPQGLLPWHWGSEALEADQIICHHDLAPYNVVVDNGRLEGIIDWDLIGPGSVRSELAFIAWQWVPLHDPVVTRFFGWPTAPDLGRRLRILLDAYRLSDRTGFIDDVITRVKLNRDTIQRKAAEGDTSFIRLQDEGHVIGMDRAIDFLVVEGDDLQANLS